MNKRFRSSLQTTTSFFTLVIRLLPLLFLFLLGRSVHAQDVSPVGDLEQAPALPVFNEQGTSPSPISGPGVKARPAVKEAVVDVVETPAPASAPAPEAVEVAPADPEGSMQKKASRPAAAPTTGTTPAPKRN